MGGKNKVLAVVFIIGCIVIAGVAATVNVVSKASLVDDNVMYEGVKIDGIDVGGMTEEEAEKAVDQHIQDILDRPVKILVNDNSVDTTFAGLGFSSDGDSHVPEAFQVGKSGSFMDRVFGSVSKEDTQYSLNYTLDKSMVEKFVQEECTVFDVKAKNSRLKYKKNGKFRATKDRTGIKLQVPETVDKIVAAIDGNTTEQSVEVEAVVKTTKPEYTREQMSKCKDLIGTYSTSYSSSTAARANNVQTAAKYINGTILYPGKIFSTVKVIKDRTEENGYQSAPEYSSGKVVNGIGGGVCQVSTTLYNAVLNAELEVVERSPHSMVVAYVSVSRDAAISGDYKDFKFKNNTDVPVYIHADASGGVLTFKIYGEETRPKNRKIEFEPEILETIQPGADVVTEDKSLPSSYREVTQSAHVGYRAKLWKIIYINGKEKERKELNTSTYNAEPQYVTIGNQGAAQTAAPATEKPSSKPEETEKPQATKKPQATRKPQPTEKPQPTQKPQPTKKPEPTKKPQPTEKPVATEEPEEPVEEPGDMEE